LERLEGRPTPPREIDMQGREPSAKGEEETITASRALVDCVLSSAKEVKNERLPKNFEAQRSWPKYDEVESLATIYYREGKGRGNGEIFLLSRGEDSSRCSEADRNPGMTHKR